MPWVYGWIPICVPVGTDHSFIVVNRDANCDRDTVSVILRLQLQVRLHRNVKKDYDTFNE